MSRRGRPFKGTVLNALNEAVNRAPIAIADVEFHYFAITASKAFRGEELRKGADDGVTTDLILRLLSNRTLEPGERCGLASLFAGDQKPPTGRPPRNLSSANLIARVFAKALRPRPGVDRKAATALVEWLRSERPLGRGEMLILAELIAGRLNPTGRPGNKGAETDRALIYAALNRAFHLKAALDPNERPDAEDDEAAKWAAAWKAEQQSYGLKSISPDHAGAAAAAWAAKDPRACGRSEETLRGLMYDFGKTWRFLRARKKLRP
jgi:hypothetical protein